ncbi:hypothetical protein BU14_1440s0001 [Porphyra umbilicalis]|uniref:Uncharacterized protein n=1 Tax=Porphyra umbilicalis TaxID=2786 RepID=A0A1X6NME4_PORUM|nr:hypothetical protein BU14_1440s0001 [Porphyra umbilicalis]|eukprot:OSX69513.1 hypothetical protein BU14_1440s0001 [Porphyra umbilicalis]
MMPRERPRAQISLGPAWGLDAWRETKARTKMMGKATQKKEKHVRRPGTMRTPRLGSSEMMLTSGTNQVTGEVCK